MYIYIYIYGSRNAIGKGHMGSALLAPLQK